MPRKISAVAPQLPVRKVPEAGVFMIIKPPRFDADNRFGNAGWALTCADAQSGEMFVLLFTDNKVRQDSMTEMRDAFLESPEPIGPCRIGQVATKGGQMTWQILDADSTTEGSQEDLPFE